jgi:septum formation protein
VRRTLILASSSPYRLALLAKLGLPFATATPDVDESPVADETPAGLATRLAMEKASVVARQHPCSLVIGSDQVAHLDGRQLTKPGNRDAAIRQLQLASGRSIAFETAVCVLDAQSGIVKSGLDRCQVTFRELSGVQIERYVDRERPYDCAGAFKSESLGIALLDRIEGNDPNALIGLPLMRLVRLLEEFGVAVL